MVSGLGLGPACTCFRNSGVSSERHCFSTPIMPLTPFYRSLTCTGSLHLPSGPQPHLTAWCPTLNGGQFPAVFLSAPVPGGHLPLLFLLLLEWGFWHDLAQGVGVLFSPHFSPSELDPVHGCAPSGLLRREWFCYVSVGLVLADFLSTLLCGSSPSASSCPACNTDGLHSPPCQEAGMTKPIHWPRSSQMLSFQLGR